MVKVINTESSFRLEWCCRLCGRKCTLDELWLAIPRGQQVEAQWAHRTCLTGVNGQIEAVFGSQRVAMMRGIDALRQLASSLQDSRDPALARQRSWGTVKAKA
jgi:hypothetical protein